MELKHLRQLLHSRALDLRSLQRLVESDQFEQAYALADDKSVAIEFITSFNRVGLDQWIKTQLKKHKVLEELSMRELRIEAQKAGVTNYNFLTKGQLVNELRDITQRNAITNS